MCQCLQFTVDAAAHPVSGLMCRNGALPAAAESCKKGTLKLDLQSLTVGVAVVSMSHWLLKARSALLHDNASPLDAARKLAVVNGLGEHSRAQVWLILQAKLHSPLTCCQVIREGSMMFLDE